MWHFLSAIVRMDRWKGFTGAETNSSANLPATGMPTSECNLEWLLCLASAFQAEQRQTSETAEPQLSRTINPKTPGNLSENATLNLR